MLSQAISVKIETTRHAHYEGVVCGYTTYSPGKVATMVITAEMLPAKRVRK